MGAHELLHFVVDVVDWVQRVLRILEALGLRGRVYLAPQRQPVDEGVVARLAVMDESRRFRDVLSVRPHARFVAGLRLSHDQEDGEPAVRRRRYVVLASLRQRGAGLLLRLRLDRVRRVEELLVGVDASLEDDAPLDPLEDGEDLGKPVTAGGFRVPVVERGRLQRMELEEVRQVFDPFADGDLPGIEYRAGERREAPAAPPADVPLDPVGPFAVLGHDGGSAPRARPHGDRVNERGFLRRRLPVLLLVPFQDGGLDEGFVRASSLLPRPGKLA